MVGLSSGPPILGSYHIHLCPHNVELLVYAAPPSTVATPSFELCWWAHEADTRTAEGALLSAEGSSGSSVSSVQSLNLLHRARVDSKASHGRESRPCDATCSIV